MIEAALIYKAMKRSSSSSISNVCWFSVREAKGRCLAGITVLIVLEGSAKISYILFILYLEAYGGVATYHSKQFFRKAFRDTCYGLTGFRIT